MKKMMCRGKKEIVDGKKDVWMERKMCGWKGGCVDGREDV